LAWEIIKKKKKKKKKKSLVFGENDYLEIYKSRKVKIIDVYKSRKLKENRLELQQATA